VFAIEERTSVGERLAMQRNLNRGVAIEYVAKRSHRRDNECNGRDAGSKSVVWSDPTTSKN
jgi:hypothetical protein